MVRYPAKGCDRVVSSLLTLPTPPGGGLGPCRAGWGHPAPRPTPWTLLRAACDPQASGSPALRRLQPRGESMIPGTRERHNNSTEDGSDGKASPAGNL